MRQKPIPLVQHSRLSSNASLHSLKKRRDLQRTFDSHQVVWHWGRPCLHTFGTTWYVYPTLIFAVLIELAMSVQNRHFAQYTYLSCAIQCIKCVEWIRQSKKKKKVQRCRARLDYLRLFLFLYLCFSGDKSSIIRRSFSFRWHCYHCCTVRFGCDKREKKRKTAVWLKDQIYSAN